MPYSGRLSTFGSWFGQYEICCCFHVGFDEIFVFVIQSKRNTTVRMHHMDADKTYWEKSRPQQLNNGTSYIEQILEATPHETAVVRLLTSHL